MVPTFQVLVFLAVSGWAHSDYYKNIFRKPLSRRCEEGEKCIPLNDCPLLREFEKGDHRILRVIIDAFGCGFDTEVHVCCKENSEKPPNYFPLQNHHLPQPPFVYDHMLYLPSIFHSRPEHEDPHDGFLSPEEDRPHKKGIDNDAMLTNEGDSLKLVYRKPEGYKVVEGKRPMPLNIETQGTQWDYATPLGKYLQFIAPQKDSWSWSMKAETNNLSSNDTYSRATPSQELASTHCITVPDWRDTPVGLSEFGNQGSYGQNFQSGKPNQGGFSNGGLLHGSHSTGQTSSQGFGGGYRPDDLDYLGGRPSSNSDYERPSNFGSDSSYVQTISGGDRPLNQGFGGSISRPSSQGFSSGRPSQSGFGNQSPQQFNSFNNERPLQAGPGYNRPGTQSFENERPGNAGFNRPDNYDTDYSRPNTGVNRPIRGRPGSERPTNQGNYNEQNSFEPTDFIGRPTNNQRPDHSRPNSEGSNKRPNGGGSNKKSPSRRLLPDGNCGTEISDKIIGGENTGLDEFPWMALLHFTTRSGQDRGFGCGGSLISERYVLTAAHCIKGPSLPQNTIVNTVRLGEYDITKENDCINGVCSPSPIDAAVEEIIVHPDYKPNDKAQRNDIALIRLRRKVPFSTYISPICVPGDELKTKDYSGKQLVVAGWGKTANGAKGKSSATKQKVSLPFVTLENCKPFYENINIRLRNTQMCAGGEKAKDSCQGDSGGPLMSNEVVNGQSSWFVTGIVSFGPEDCGVKDIAGVYTKVSQYVDWILENMKD